MPWVVQRLEGTINGQNRYFTISHAPYVETLLVIFTGIPMEIVGSQPDLMQFAFSSQSMVVELGLAPMPGQHPWCRYFYEEGGGLVTAKELPCAPVSFSMVGLPAGVLKTSLLNVAPTSFALGGASMTLIHASPSSLQPASYSLSGVAATLLRSRVLALQPTSFNTTGIDADLTMIPVSGLPFDYYASPDGGGNGSSPSSPFQIADFWAVAGPGSSLGLVDGVYTDSSSNIAPPANLNGSAGNPISIAAVNDGMVRIDGGAARIPINLVNNAYFAIQGINVNNGFEQCVLVGSASTYNTIRRVIAWDAYDGNNQIWWCGGSYNLFEDCAGFGVGRKTFGSQPGNYNIYRRCWGRWEGSTNVGPKDVFELVYANTRNTFENCIATWNTGCQPQDYWLQNNGGLYQNPGSTHYTNGEVDQPYGCIAEGDAVDAWLGVYGCIVYIRASDAVPPNYPDGCFFFHVGNLAYFANCAAFSGHSGIYTFLMSSNGTQNEVTATTGIGGAGNYIEPGWTESNNEHGATVNDVSSIYESGTGAGIVYRYENGTPTAVPLWPWPMNQRIIDATTLANDAGHQHYMYQGAGPTLTLLNRPHEIADVDAAIQECFGSYPSEGFSVIDNSGEQVTSGSGNVNIPTPVEVIDNAGASITDDGDGTIL